MDTAICIAWQLKHQVSTPFYALTLSFGLDAIPGEDSSCKAKVVGSTPIPGSVNPLVSGLLRVLDQATR